MTHWSFIIWNSLVILAWSLGIAFRPGGGHLLILLLQIIDQPLDPIRFVDQPLLLAAEGGDDFVLCLGGITQRLLVGFDVLLPACPEAIDMLLVDVNVRKSGGRRH